MMCSQVRPTQFRWLPAQPRKIQLRSPADQCAAAAPRSTITVTAATGRSLSPRRRFQVHAHQSVTSPGAAVASEHLKISGRGPESGLGVYQTVEPTGLLTRKPNLMYQSAGLTRKSNAMYRSAMMVTQGNGTHAIRIEADFVCNV